MNTYSIGTQMSGAERRALDAYAKREHISRSAALRRLVREGLERDRLRRAQEGQS